MTNAPKTPKKLSAMLILAILTAGLWAIGVSVASAIATQQGKLTAADGAEFDTFGWSVDIDGDTAIVGSFRDDDE